MILTDFGIRYHLINGGVFIKDFDASQLNPNSYDVRLGYWFIPVLGHDGHKTLYGDIYTYQDGADVTLHHSMYLVSTMDFLGTEADSKVVMSLKAKSSWERRGFIMSPGAGFGDIGYINHWTVLMYIPLANKIRKPVVRVGERFMQAIFTETHDKADRAYSGQYADEMPYAMLPAMYRDSYKYIRYEEGVTIISQEDDDET